LILQPGEAVYIDANVLIYSVEREEPYTPILDAFWRDIHSQQRPALTSELTALEVLVGPIKAGDNALEALFRTACTRPRISTWRRSLGPSWSAPLICAQRLRGSKRPTAFTQPLPWNTTVA
jgi:hypothetical protein